MKQYTAASIFSGAVTVLKNYFIQMRFFFLIFGATGIFFALFPQVDPAISGLFYNSQAGFYLAEIPPFMVVYHGVHYLTILIIAVLVIIFSYSLIKKRETVLGLNKKAVIFLLVGLIFSAGIVVNVILKEGVGRPRPQDVTLFGGTAQFQPPFVISKECKDNCSFVSGHASLGFYLMAAGFIATGLRRKYLIASGFAAGWIIGFVRVIQGRHFFTDVLFAFFFVYAALRLVHDFIYNGKYYEDSV